MLNKYSQELDNTDNHVSNSVIATYINLKDNLSKKEISFIENHLNKCDECRKKLDEMIKEDFEIDEAKELQDYKITRLQNYKIWTAAAVIIVALGIGVYYILQPVDERIIVQDDKPLIDSLETEEDIPVKPEKKETIKEIENDYNKADFAANNILENFINRNVRSERLVKIITPGIADTLKTPVTFSWEGQNGDKFILELVNNRNNLITKQILTENNYIYSEKLNVGLYYWKLFVDDKLEAVGKFYISP